MLKIPPLEYRSEFEQALRHFPCNKKELNFSQLHYSIRPIYTLTFAQWPNLHVGYKHTHTHAHTNYVFSRSLCKVHSRQVKFWNRRIPAATSVPPAVHAVYYALWIASWPRTCNNICLHVNTTIHGKKLRLKENHLYKPIWVEYRHNTQQSFTAASKNKLLALLWQITVRKF